MSTALMDRPSALGESLWGEEGDAQAPSSPSALGLLSPLTDEESAPRPEAQQEPDGDSRRIFDELADELAIASRGLSSTRLAYRHPAYVEIMALGEQSIPWLVERLETPGDRPIWLRMLGSMTRFQPGAGSETIPEAAAAWIRWNKRRQAAQ